MNNAQKERLFELLADDALDGLSGEERVELNNLKKQFPEWEKDFSHELAAAAIGLSDLKTEDAMPANLRAKILSDAEDYFSRASSDFSAEENKTAFQAENIKPTFSLKEWLGWAVAATACIALAINLWLTHSQTETAGNHETIETPKPVQTATPIVEAANAAKEREQLIATAPDVVKADLKAADVKSFENLSADVVWSNALQKGFVRLRGMPANDAAKETYQLWIVDAAQNEKTPVSGGVFDVRQEAGEIIIPIDAELKIKLPKAFAVSREKPGGVVVSSPQRVVAVGKI